MQISELYRLYQEHPVIVTDSRECAGNSMFFALKGANFDGNAYAAVALEKGAAIAVVDDAEYVPDGDSRYVLVDDVLETLQSLAAFHRQQLDIPVLQITGTNGKTTTKELVSAVLSRKFNTLYTKGNLNNHIGVPLTLLRIRPEHQIAVIETGANHPGEIEFLCRMVKADCGLITNVGRAHLEGFGSFEGVKKTKGELYDDLVARHKFCFLNMMDLDLMDMAVERNIQQKPYVQGVALTDGKSGNDDTFNPFLKVRWLTPYGTAADVQTRLIGDYNLPNVLAAVTVGLHFGVALNQINEALEQYEPNNNRSEYRRTEKNELIVDAYNANASSMAVALDNFRAIQHPGKMVVLGEMREMGAESVSEHQKVADRLAQMDLIETWLVGNEFGKCDTSAIRNVTLFANVDEVKKRLAESGVAGRLILIKGSNGTRLYQLPELL